MARLGVIGSMVWDEIHGRDPLSAPVEEWGGIAYALSALDAALDPDWEIVPLIKVGRDLAPRAADFLAGLRHRIPGARFIEVPATTQRVTLRYDSAERRCERMTGGVPPWTWEELGPMVADLDALYVNFISGHELSLATAQLLRRGFAGPIYADLHSLTLGTAADGLRFARPLPDAPAWFGAFDIVQCNEDEFDQMAPVPAALMAAGLQAGLSLLNVTLGTRGVVYVARAGFERLDDRRRPPLHDRGPVRTELLAPPSVDAVDPTGCGDVFGATCFARLLAGEGVTDALAAANRAAARNATFRGAGRLGDFLRGRLVLT